MPTTPQQVPASDSGAPESIRALIVTSRGDAYVSPVGHDSDGFSVFGNDWEALVLTDDLLLVVDIETLQNDGPVNVRATEFLHFLGQAEVMHGGQVVGDAAFIGTGGTNPWYADVPASTVQTYDWCISTPMVRERHPKR